MLVSVSVNEAEEESRKERNQSRQVSSAMLARVELAVSMQPDGLVPHPAAWKRADLQDAFPSLPRLDAQAYGVFCTALIPVRT